MKRLTSVFSVAMLSALGALLITCTEEKTIVNPAPAIDHIAPEVEWITPLSSSELSGDVTLTFTAADSGGIARISLYRNGSSPADWQIIPHTDSLYTLNWNTRLVNDGLYILEVRAWDESGNPGISPSLVVRVKNAPTPPPDDRTPPTIFWLAPEPEAVVSDSVTLQFRVVDSSAIADVIIRKDGFSAWRLAVIDSGYYEYQWDSRADSDGVHLWEVWAWDAAGNTGVSPALLVRVNNATPPPPPPEEDNTPPDVWWVSPDGGATLWDTVLLQVRVFDESGVDSVALYLDGEFRSAGVPAGNGYEYLWDTSADSDGVHLWEARAWDASGNAGVSPALLVKVQNNPQPPAEDHTPPVIVWLSPEPGDTVQGTVDLRFNVLDDDRVDSVKVYLNGRAFQTFANADTLFNYEVQWATDENEDGNYIFQVKAWDRSLNVGLSEVVWFHVWNNRPRLIWVPDDYETIQRAISASENGDTVRVRQGTYEEWLNMLDKNIWLESESGPESTVIDLTGAYAFWIEGGQDTTAGIRGFTFENNSDFNCLNLILSGGNPKVVNNIFTGPRSYGGVETGHTNAQIRNNLMINMNTGASIAHSWGDFSNNMIVHMSNRAFWNAAINGQPLVPDYNLFYDYTSRNTGYPIQWGENNIFDREPLFEEVSYKLREDSPGIDEGRPDLQDIDGSRSDIGVYGGPLSYPPPNH
jgi:hypothetical protein